MKNQLNKVYSQVLEKIYKEVNRAESIELNADIPDIFIPGVGKLYTHLEKKILYIGNDTNDWYSMKESAFEYSTENDEIEKHVILEKIISRASDNLQFNKHIEWWDGGKSKFWDYIFRLQRCINDSSCTEVSGNADNDTIELSKESLGKHEKITQSFAWANSKLLQQLMLDNNIKDSDLYKKINSVTFNKKEERNIVFNWILKALQPDIIIILNWSEYLSFIGKYTKKITFYDKYKDRIADNLINIEHIEKVKIEYYQLESGQHVFWTYHPQGIVRSKRGTIEDWVQAMFRFMKDENVI